MPKAFMKSKFFACQRHAVNHLKYLDKQGALFSPMGTVALQDALQQTAACEKSIKWRMIFSLQEEDAQRLGIDRNFMQQLVTAQKAEWAKAYNISPENLVLYASFHDVAHHPHLHIVMYSKNVCEGYVVQSKDKTQGEAFKRSRETVKGSIANAIFKDDLHELLVNKSHQRTELNRAAEKLLLSMGKSEHNVSPEIVYGMEVLSKQLEKVGGKHQYGYLPPDIKTQVDDLLRTIIEHDSALQRLFTEYRETQKSLTETYMDSKITMAKKLEKWDMTFFSPTKGEDTARHNIIIKAADNLRSMERYKEKDFHQSNSSTEQQKAENQEPNEIPNIVKSSDVFAPTATPYASHSESHHTEYTFKTNMAAARNLLYEVGRTINTDTRRLMQAMPPSAAKPKKIRVKKIQKEKNIEVEPIDIGGK
ncbi:MAG: relaxase MobL [Oscillospiraceae bacterium]